jgi:hypothetical protein
VAVNLRGEQKAGIGFVGYWNMALKWLEETNRAVCGHANGYELLRENIVL